MPLYQDYINQSKRNISFLIFISESSDKYWDWEVTVSFYIGVHLINAHLCKSISTVYRTHENVDSAINPNKNSVSLGKVSEEIYLAYKNLSNLSRISRYLSASSDTSLPMSKTKSKHLFRAIESLDTLMVFIADKYGVEFEKQEINCDLLDKKVFSFFCNKKLEAA